MQTHYFIHCSPHSLFFKNCIGKNMDWSDKSVNPCIQIGASNWGLQIRGLFPVNCKTGIDHYQSSFMVV